MVLLTLTAALSSKLQALSPVLPSELLELVEFHSDPSSSESSSSSPTTSQQELEDKTIDHAALVKVAKWVQTHSEEVEDKLNESRDDYRLAKLLKLTQVHAPPLKPREKTPELLAILASIQLSQDRLAYTSLTSLQQPSYRSLIPMTDVHASQTPKTVAEEWGQIKKELSAIVNVLVSMAAVFTGVWYVGFGYSHAIRLGLSLFGAITIAAIEGWLYWRVFSRVEQGKVEAEKWKNGGSEGVRAGKVLKFE
ncbi:hypothetical protein JCM3765_000775 [Sporobolomyces pararoseus]